MVSVPCAVTVSFSVPSAVCTAARVPVIVTSLELLPLTTAVPPALLTESVPLVSVSSTVRVSPVAPSPFSTWFTVTPPIPVATPASVCTGPTAEKVGWPLA